jgi:hypothetical protein
MNHFKGDEQEDLYFLDAANETVEFWGTRTTTLHNVIRDKIIGKIKQRGMDGAAVSEDSFQGVE